MHFLSALRTLAVSRSQMIETVQRGLQLPDGTAFTPHLPKAMSDAAGFNPLTQQLPGQSLQDLAGILSTL